MHVFINPYGYFWISPLLFIKMSISPWNCSPRSISIIHICLHMFSASSACFLVAIFGSSCFCHQMSLPHIKNGCHVSSLHQNACSYVFHTYPLDPDMFSASICRYFIFLLPHPQFITTHSYPVFFFSSPVLLSPPSRHMCTCRCRSQTLFQLLEQRVVSNAKLNGREVENSLCTSRARFTTQTLKPQ